MTGVVHCDEVEGRIEAGAEVRTTFDASNGCERLEQHLIRVVPGRPHERRVDVRQEILYVVSGRGTLELKGERHSLEPETGVYIAPGETFSIEADDELVLVGVAAARQSDVVQAVRKVTVRLADQPELEASSERSFRYLVNEEAGCPDVTQFVGTVQPSKAPFHSHPYDEVGYVIEGEGIAHIDGRETPLRSGSCFHLAPGQIHCIENCGAGPMRILGVFHPSGSPASRDYQGNI